MSANTQRHRYDVQAGVWLEGLGRVGAEAVWKHCVILSSRTSDAVHAASSQQGQEVLCWEATSKAVHRKHTSRIHDD